MHCINELHAGVPHMGGGHLAPPPPVHPIGAGGQSFVPHCTHACTCMCCHVWPPYIRVPMHVWPHICASPCARVSLRVPSHACASSHVCLCAPHACASTCMCAHMSVIPGVCAPVVRLRVRVSPFLCVWMSSLSDCVSGRPIFYVSVCLCVCASPFLHT